MRDPTGGLEGRAGRWLTFASCLLGRPQQFMNDSLYCQADSLLAWGPGLGEAAAAPSFTSHTSHAGAHMWIHTRAHAQAWLQQVHYPAMREGYAHHWSVENKVEVSVNSLPVAIYIQIN